MSRYLDGDRSEATGEVLAANGLPAQASSAPTTFLLDGRQMIVVGSSHREHAGELVALLVGHGRAAASP